MRQEEGEVEAFSKVQTDINYPYSALASEDRSSMPPRRVEKASRAFCFCSKNFIFQERILFFRKELYFSSPLGLMSISGRLAIAALYFPAKRFIFCLR